MTTAANTNKSLAAAVSGRLYVCARMAMPADQPIQTWKIMT
jgi:hypothetical protein